ncbi:peptidoglycan -binding protein [Roseomonas sp. M0104]|uniref:Peptidoglycan-binding protein n=1 Tax=Teichococcus coralli TaxID=2545983 RepID=A0A845BJ37_9PROT|nr:peptidoglycan -binding protein [Pseudoroseomonas coralli]MXP63459.1 peptidoglycan -binding protein [Pseudoroseomonas coralli]
MPLSRRGAREAPNAWPGYVDALSTLLMVIIFVLLVFVLAQGFLSVTLTSRDKALDRLNQQVAELSDMLALERGQGQELRANLSRLSDELRIATGAREAALAQVTSLREERDRQGAERDSLKTERDRLAARLADLELTASGSAGRIASLEERLAAAQSRAESIGGDTAQTLQNLTETRRTLADERQNLQAARTQIQALQDRAAAAESSRDRNAQALAQTQQQLQAAQQTADQRQQQLNRLAEQIRALTALRDELEKRVADVMARAEAQEQQTRGEAERRQQAEAKAGEQVRLAESAQAQVALLNRQLTELRAELARMAGLLDVQVKATRDKDVQIADLGQRLNTALAARVEELQRYRSDFFGRLRDVLGERQEVRIVGDRFVFQGEVLFPVGSADLSAAGQQQLRELAEVLKEVSKKFPADLPWILRVDGHADRSPVRPGGRYASNWELSAARAIAVAQFLITQGLPANHVAAAAFGDNQPIDAGDSPEALARNRRIELRLTDR